jgi:hypothetical protein
VSLSLTGPAFGDASAYDAASGFFSAGVLLDVDRLWRK